MKTKTTLKFFIAALLLSFFVTKTNAQIVYVDIDPDTTIYLPNVPFNVDSANHYEFDINNDLINDFQFTARNFYFGVQQYGNGLTLASLSNQFVSGGCATGGFREDIILNDTINKNLNWSTNKYLKYTSNANPFFCDIPVGDTYFGLMTFENTDTLYSWIRCSATYNSITVKDYSYNTIPNMPILAGQTILGFDTLTQSNQISIYVSNALLTINLNGILNPQGYIRIYNNQGVLVKTNVINGINNEISLSGILSGIYIVQVQTQTETINKQILLQSN